MDQTTKKMRKKILQFFAIFFFTFGVICFCMAYVQYDRDHIDEVALDIACGLFVTVMGRNFLIGSEKKDESE